MRRYHICICRDCLFVHIAVLFIYKIRSISMKIKEKNKAIELRKQGVSIGEIARRIGTSKGSVSYWVRDVALTKTQRTKLNKNGHSIDAIEKRRISRMANTRLKRELIKEAAGNEVVEFQKDPLWCIGVALYWGEGGKTQQTARLANSDPGIIKIMMRFFERYSGVSKDKYRGHVHTFSHKSAEQAVQYWSKISGIPVKQFFKTYQKQSSASLKKRETLPYGTLQIYILETTFFFRLMGWINELKKLGKK